MLRERSPHGVSVNVHGGQDALLRALAAGGSELLSGARNLPVRSDACCLQKLKVCIGLTSDHFFRRNYDIIL